MEAEIIAVGTEILMGQIVNTNAAFLAQQLNALGFNTYHESVVGDNPARLLENLQLAQARSDLVVLSGGLGPTTDDLTKQTVAKFLGRDLFFNETAMEKINLFFQRRNRVVTENNRLQALSIAGGIVLENPAGLAVGTLINQDNTYYLLLPGPPSELMPMFLQVARLHLEKILPQEDHLYSEVLRFFGIGEAQLATELQDLIAQQTNPTVAPYAKLHEVTLRITAQATTLEKGWALVQQLKEKILAQVGEFYYGSGDENSLAQVVVEKLKANQLTLSAVESLTAGLFQATLGEIAGVSKVFPGGLITYSPEAKIKTAHVPATLIEKYGVVSSEVAESMAQNTREIFDTDLAISFTGVAGPEPLENRPAGTVYIGLATRHGVMSLLLHLNRDRNYIRQQAVMEGLSFILKNIFA
ncbi:competence/damage-inducible protein A [Enterococcus timonensis]|uniref:competence/damage-inducible protein A n=1 Tax=Enterococcus timonensis TaxID=1852364 RepID=UPI0008DAA263|nr:competence/damage-inducible protein A [Enterococcus timonensis]